LFQLQSVITKVKMIDHVLVPRFSLYILTLYATIPWLNYCALNFHNVWPHPSQNKLLQYHMLYWSIIICLA